ncbi:MAG TPA: hypothetical protein VIM11_23985 [Tepidisphaeraceae bacterium]
MERWRPTTHAELVSLLADAEEQLTGASQGNYRKYKVAPWQATICRGEEYGIEKVWVVAQSDHQVIFFDDIEDEFACGKFDSDGQITSAALIGDLQYAMIAFPPPDIPV